MKLAAMGVFREDLADVRHSDLVWLKELGIEGAGVHVTCPPKDIPRARIGETRALFADVGIELIQCWGPYASLVSADAEERAQGIRGASDVIQLASDLGARAAGIRPTSRAGSAMPWAPHPENHAPEARKKFEDALHELATAATRVEIPLVLEPHSTSVLKDPETIVEIVNSVGSDRVMVNIDVVNFIHDVETAYNSSPLVEECILTLATMAHSIQIKDYVIDPSLVLHISETVPGRGLLDIENVLNLLEPWPDLWVAVEHLTRQEIPEAIAHLKGCAGRTLRGSNDAS